MNCEIYDLGSHPACGVMKLPFASNGMGNYYMRAKVGRSAIDVPFPEITNENMFFFFDGGKMPMLRDLEFSIYKTSDHALQTFNLTRNLGTDCVPSNQTKCFSVFRIFFQPIFGLIDYEIQFPDSNAGGGDTLLFSDIKFVTGTSYTYTYNIPNLTLYTPESVNSALHVFVNGVRYYWNEGELLYQDQFGQNFGSDQITVRDDISGGWLAVDFYDNRLVLK